MKDRNLEWYLCSEIIITFYFSLGENDTFGPIEVLNKIKIIVTFAGKKKPCMYVF